MTEEITSTPRHTMRCWCFGDLLVPWLRDYDRLQHLAVILIYIQIACALVGSLGAQYNGVLLINLAIALFALVAIESSSQSLGRTYAVLLFCAVLLDITWFILFTHDIWYISSEVYGPYFIFSVRLTLAMQVIGFTVRLSSSFLWIQIYKLGVSNGADYYLRNSFLNPVTPAAVRQSSGSDDAAGSMYDPAYYSSLFEDGQNMKNTLQEHNSCPGDDESPAAAVASRLKPLILRTSETVDVESLETNCQNGGTATNTSHG